jgi:hypothetical protein
MLCNGDWSGYRTPAPVKRTNDKRRSIVASSFLSEIKTHIMCEPRILNRTCLTNSENKHAYATASPIRLGTGHQGNGFTCRTTCMRPVVFSGKPIFLGNYCASAVVHAKCSADRHHHTGHTHWFRTHADSHPLPVVQTPPNFVLNDKHRKGKAVQDHFAVDDELEQRIDLYLSTEGSNMHHSMHVAENKNGKEGVESLEHTSPRSQR